MLKNYATGAVASASVCLRVRFGESSLLMRIGNQTFFESTLIGFDIPDRAEELGEDCFGRCKRLST